MSLQRDLQAAKARARQRARVLLLGLALGLPALGLGLHAWINRDRGPEPPVFVLDAGEGQAQKLAPGLFHARIQGEGYALGYSHGRSMGPEVRALADYLRDELLGRGLLGALRRDLLLRQAWALDAHIPPRYRMELRGVADGAAVPYADVLLINTYDDLLYLVGCSSAVALPEGKEPLRHARNLDYPIEELARRKLVLDLETRGKRLRTVGFPGYIGVLTGMSDRGLGLTSHTSASRENKPGVPTGILYRMALEEASSIAELQRTVARAHRTIGNNLALSDARTGQALALEFDATALAARPTEGGRIFVTNHFQTPAMQSHQSQAWWTPSSGSSARVACLAEALPKGPLELSRFQAAMSQEGPGKAWRTPANGGTVQSVIMEPATGRLWVASGSGIPVTRGGYLDLGRAW